MIVNFTNVIEGDPVLAYKKGHIIRGITNNNISGFGLITSTGSWYIGNSGVRKLFYTTEIKSNNAHKKGGGYERQNTRLKYLYLHPTDYTGARKVSSQAYQEDHKSCHHN